MARATKTQEGISYRYENGKLILTACPQEIVSLDFSVPFAEGEVTKIEVQFKTNGVQGKRFFAASELILPKTLKEFPCFGGCFSSIKRLDIPMNCKKFSGWDFAGWGLLQEIDLPQGVKKIPERMFAWCMSLSRIILPNSVKVIDKNAFEECNELTEIAIPEGVEEIKEDTFLKCINLQKIVIPNSVKTIKKNAFKGCKKLLRVDLPETTKYDKKSFPNTTKIFVNGIEQIPAPEEFRVKLSSIVLRDADVKETREKLVEGQTIEVHSVIHRFTPRLEAMTKEGEHIGFLATTVIQKLPRFKKIPEGQAFDAVVKFGSNGKIEFVFMENAEFYPTAFPEQGARLNWKRENYAADQLPLNEADFDVALTAYTYRPAHDADSIEQYKEYEKAFSQEQADRVYIDDERWQYTTYTDELSTFRNQDMSLTMLEHIPLGTEFQVKMGTVYLQVGNNSWGYGHAGGSEDYGYPVPAFLLYHQGVRVANVPLVFDSYNRQNSYNAFLAFWKWSKQPTLKPRAWLCNIINSEPYEYGEAPKCLFSIGFFPGNIVSDEQLDMKDAITYCGECDEKNRYLSTKKLMEFFAKAEEINLSLSGKSAESSVWLKNANNIYTLPAGLYQDEPAEYTELYKEPSEEKWYTLRQLEQRVYEKRGESQTKYLLDTSGRFSTYFIAAGTHLEERRKVCLERTNREEVEVIRERENAYDPNALAIKTVKGEMCGYIPAEKAKWISCLLDAGIIQLEKSYVAEIMEWENMEPQKPTLQLEIGCDFCWDEKKFAVLSGRKEQPIPFVLMKKDPENPDKLIPLEIYQKTPELFAEYEEFYHELLDDTEVL